MQVYLVLSDDEIRKINRDPAQYYPHFFVPDKKPITMNERELSETLYFLPKTDENMALRYYLQRMGEESFGW